MVERELHVSTVTSERGATAVIVAGSLVLLMGIAAFAVDLGAQQNSRRGDQTAADVGAMAGAVGALSGVGEIRDQALSYVRKNLDTDYSDAEWSTLWTSCTDPDLVGINANGFNFAPVPRPPAWGGGTLPCLSIDPAGFVRVRVPQQIIDTSFAPVVGVDELESSASAIARLAPRSASGVLPFGLTSTAGNGQHVCLSSGPTGLAVDPCTGSVTGNFGTIKGRLFGNAELGTTTNCTASPANQVLATNIAVGMDHLIVTDPDGLTANEVRDVCFNIGVDTLNTDPGFAQGVETGLATGPIDAPAAPRLQQGSNGKVSVINNSRRLDNRPLWDYIDGSLPGALAPTSGAIPSSCVRSTFLGSNPDSNWDSDPELEAANSFEHMARCLSDYASGGWTTPMFSPSLANSPRFSYTPQFWEPTLGTGNDWRHVLRFKAVFIQGTWWKKGNEWIVFHPGEDCRDEADLPRTNCVGSGNWSMTQMSSFVIPDTALPAELRGSTGPGGGLNPYDFELYR
jgi:hypothetical protein